MQNILVLQRGLLCSPMVNTSPICAAKDGILEQWCLGYRIAENLQVRKLRKLAENTIFTEKTFTDCSLVLPVLATPAKLTFVMH